MLRQHARKKKKRAHARVGVRGACEFCRLVVDELIERAGGARDDAAVEVIEKVRQDQHHHDGRRREPQSPRHYETSPTKPTSGGSSLNPTTNRTTMMRVVARNTRGPVKELLSRPPCRANSQGRDGDPASSRRGGAPSWRDALARRRSSRSAAARRDPLARAGLGDNPRHASSLMIIIVHQLAARRALRQVPPFSSWPSCCSK